MIYAKFSIDYEKEQLFEKENRLLQIETNRTVSFICSLTKFTRGENTLVLGKICKNCVNYTSDTITDFPEFDECFAKAKATFDLYSHNPAKRYFEIPENKERRKVPENIRGLPTANFCPYFRNLGEEENSR